ncbi:hypothetical protein SAMN02746009_03782 [Hymenobacter psychrotolerans DSM 18569]|uniref:Uncharacterized protein n=1 Tax=Hymenobacter psychrotolerans DSM 18569 TaxID=1121959 RepID=A0A1M7F8I6_9BACT|nr:hypothetical protein SAMN02746009_03782 [Hymenobacter psychrotolerans DSM 18569]
MPVIEILTLINAPQERCFQLALSVDLHPISAGQTKEELIGDIYSGILQLGDSVTFRARRFGVWQTLTSITSCQLNQAPLCGTYSSLHLRWVG